MSKLLTIKAREPLDDGGFLTGYNSLFMVGDEEVSGITKADIRFRPGEIVTAKLELYVNVDLDGVEIDPPKPGKLTWTGIYRGVKMDVTSTLSETAFNMMHRERWENSVNRAYHELTGRR